MTLAVGRLWCVQGRAYRNPRPPSLFLTVTLTGFCLLAVTMVRWWPQREEPMRIVVTAGLASDDPAAESELRRHWLDAPSSLPYNLSDTEDYIRVAKGDTWPFIHHYIKRLFSGETDGFFVEAGALDGQMLSNTLWLERENGWRGLLVEPDPFSYSCLLTKRRKAWTSNTCLSTSGLTNTSVHVSLSLAPKYVSPRWYMKGASHELGVTMRDPSNVNYVNSGVKSFSLVSCFPLATYLRALNVTVVDLLSLDTQGSEISIIKTLPWEEVRVRVMVVEVAAPEFQHDFVEYMRGRGFTLVGHYNDYIFVQEGDAALARLRAQEGWYIAMEKSDAPT